MDFPEMSPLLRLQAAVGPVVVMLLLNPPFIPVPAAAEQLPVYYRESGETEAEATSPARFIDNAAYIREFQQERRAARRRSALSELIIIQEYRLPACEEAAYRRYQESAFGVEYRHGLQTWRWYRGYLSPDRGGRRCLDPSGTDRR